MKAKSELVKQCSGYMFTTTGLGMEEVLRLADKAELSFIIALV